MIGQMREVMTNPKHLFTIRISSYFTGALMINALRGAGVYRFETADRPCREQGTARGDHQRDHGTAESRQARQMYPQRRAAAVEPFEN